MDIACGEKAKGFTAETAEVLRIWQDPASLAIVQGTPVNCLVVSWAAGLPADADQPAALKPLIEKGRQAGLGFVGVIAGQADKPAAVASAQAAGLTAVAMDGGAPASAGIPVIPWNKASQVRPAAKSPVVGISDGIWPGLPQAASQAGGPTNLPWVDSNGAPVLIVRTLAPDKTVWIAFDPPQQKLPAEAYVLAVADAASYGAKWVISLDDQLRADLAARKQPAADVWKKLNETLAFFDQHKQSRTFQPDGPLAVVSNFSGPNWDAAEEAINLFPRIRQPFRVIARSRAMGASFAGLQAVLYVDQEAPDAALRQKLIAFAQGGGTLFVPSKWPNPEGLPLTAEPYLMFNLRKLGNGRLAVCKDAQPDPSDLVDDIQNVISHRNDILRLYNAPSMNFLYETSAQGGQGVIHLLNFSRRPGSDGPLFYVKEPHKSARLVSPELASPAELAFARQEAGGAELFLPKLSVYGAIELEK
ncbi:MAG TPA: hypothetical protein VKF41_08045 [Bryobacteraceae bacterium]|nr:hypothetical protein [Bryobacteraceae bacterium]